MNPLVSLHWDIVIDEDRVIQLHLIVQRNVEQFVSYQQLLFFLTCRLLN